MASVDTGASETVPPIDGLAFSRRVLVADDNADAADTTALLLEAFGCRVKTVYSGEAAVRGAEEFRPEVVLLDLGMLEVDGYEVCRPSDDSLGAKG